MWKIIEGNSEESVESEILRQKLKDYYGTAIQNFPMAVMELSDIDSMDDEELLRKAKESGLL